jgi:hypothetical protein
MSTSAAIVSSGLNIFSGADRKTRRWPALTVAAGTSDGYSPPLEWGEIEVLTGRPARPVAHVRPKPAVHAVSLYLRLPALSFIHGEKGGMKNDQGRSR